MAKLNLEDLTFKDVLTGISIILFAMLGFMIKEKLSDIDQSIKDFKQFQIEQRVETQKINGQVELLHAKDLELEKKNTALEEDLKHCVKRR